MPAPDVALALFAKAPRPGRVKTRLAPALGLDGAARLYQAFVRDELAVLRARPRFAVTIWAAAKDDVDGLAELAPDLPIAIQPVADLGERMTAALDAGLVGHPRALVLGTDVPTLAPAALDGAVALLEDPADVSLGPTADGGYCLLGASTPGLTLTGIRWSTPHALADTEGCVRAQGRRPRLGAPGFDVDEPSDLTLLRVALRLRPSLAPHTRAMLAELDG